MPRESDTEARPADFVMEGLSHIDELDRSFDIEFWQRQDSNARFGAAWELVVFAHKRKGQDESELRLQRTIESLEPREQGAEGKEQRERGKEPIENETSFPI